MSSSSSGNLASQLLKAIRESGKQQNMSSRLLKIIQDSGNRKNINNETVHLLKNIQTQNRGNSVSERKLQTEIERVLKIASFPYMFRGSGKPRSIAVLKSPKNNSGTSNNKPMNNVGTTRPSVGYLNKLKSVFPNMPSLPGAPKMNWLKRRFQTNLYKSITNVANTNSLTAPEKITILKEFLNSNSRNKTVKMKLLTSIKNQSVRNSLIHHVASSTPRQPPSASARPSRSSNSLVSVLERSNINNDQKVILLNSALRSNSRSIREQMNIVSKSSLSGRAKTEILSRLAEKNENERNREQERKEANREREQERRERRREIENERREYNRERREPSYYRGGIYNNTNRNNTNYRFKIAPPTQRSYAAPVRNNYQPMNFGNNANRNTFPKNNMNRGLNRNTLPKNNMNRGFNRNTTSTLVHVKKARSRPVRMKLLKETVDNVKKKKLIKQIKKLGKKDTDKIIKQSKSKLVKYIVKEIRPAVKKTKKSVQRLPVNLKEDQHVLFKNTFVSNNGRARNGTGNQGLYTGNAQNTRRYAYNAAPVPS